MRAWRFLYLICCCLVAPDARAGSLPREQPWWHGAVLYEIYPRSFQDSDGDGVGDLNGITRRLDYLESLGIDAIWIAPLDPSPQVDFGYDISDYRAIDPRYGTLADFDRLLRAAERHHIRILLDMVLNHTSDQHPWFREAASSRSAPRHGFYVWSEGKPGPDGKRLPPNNWVSLFGGSAWEYLPGVRQFYYHKFYKQQPDLNWRNPAVEAAMFAAMRFWLERGVAGFRLDAITTLFEDAALRDARTLGGTNAQGDPNLDDVYTNNLPDVHAVLRRMRALTDGYPGERILIGETYLPSTAELDKWYGGERKDELQLPMDLLVGFINRLSATEFRRRLSEAQTLLHGSEPLLVFDNHDNVRSWDRYGDGLHNAAIARLIATVLLTARGTALLYQGEELGMTTATPTRVEDVRDPIGVTGWPREKGRDGERTPMQWDAGPQAGFSTTARTWLPVQTNYREFNVASESRDPGSLLNWHRELIELRRKLPAVHHGRMVMLDEQNPSVLCYARVARGSPTIVVALNMSGVPAQARLDLRRAGLAGGRLRTLLASQMPRPAVRGSRTAPEVSLAPFAAWVAATESCGRAKCAECAHCGGQ